MVKQLGALILGLTKKQAAALSDFLKEENGTVLLHRKNNPDLGPVTNGGCNSGNPSDPHYGEDGYYSPPGSCNWVAEENE